MHCAITGLPGSQSEQGCGRRHVPGLCPPDHIGPQPPMRGIHLDPDIVHDPQDPAAPQSPRRSCSRSRRRRCDDWPRSCGRPRPGPRRRSRAGTWLPARLGEQSLASGDSACRETYHRSARLRCSHQEDAGRGRLLQRQPKAGQACTGRAFRCCRKPTRLDLAGRCASASAADRVGRRGPGARHGHARVAGRQPRTLLAEGEAGREACHGERPECSRTRAKSRRSGGRSHRPTWCTSRARTA